MAYHSKYTGAEVDALLDKIKDDDVGDIDSSLSTTSENPVMNKVITVELNNKADKGEVTASLNTKADKNETDTKLATLSGEVIELELFKTAVLESSVNLFNPTTAIVGYFWDKAGIKNAASGYAITAPVYLESGKRYKMPFDSGAIGSNNRGFLVTEDNTLINAISGNVVDSFITFEIASSGYYSFNIGYARSIPTFMIAEESEYPNGYVEYGFSWTLPDLDMASENLSKLHKKKVTFDGDSICAGAGFLGGYGKIIAERNNMQYHNLGVGGGTITANTYSGDYARHWICQSVVNIDPNSDYVILEGGVNDSSLKVDLGEISNGYSAALDEATFCGAFESMVKKCYANFPSAKLGFIFPHKMTSGYYEGGAYYEKAISILHKWGVPYIDLTRLAPPLNDISALRNAFTYNSDGWHPNEDGYKAFYCDKIEEWMKSL